MRHRYTRRNGPNRNEAQVIESIRQKIASNLRIDPDRIQRGRLGRKGKLGTDDPHWMIFYRGEWRELPWHFDGPLSVTREMVRQWHDVSP